MGRVVIAQTDEAPKGAFPRLTGVSSDRGAASRGVIAEGDRPLLLWMHHLSPGSEIRCDAPPVDHLFYVWEGEIETDGRSVPTDGATIVESKASATLRAGKNGATLAHFHQREGESAGPVRGGGHVHVLSPDGILRAEKPDYGLRKVLYADSSCPTCELWLHKNWFTRAHPLEGRHFHPEDEIILVRQGLMAIGRQRLGPGTALAIDGSTIYTFTVPDEGLEFLNFRTREPFYVRVGPKNEPLNEPISELVLAHRMQSPNPA